jgi:hypothetical protein
MGRATCYGSSRTSYLDDHYFGISPKKLKQQVPGVTRGTKPREKIKIKGVETSWE